MSAGDAAADAILRSLLNGRRWLDFSPLASSDPIARLSLRTAGAAHARTISRPMVRSPYIELTGDWDEFEARLSNRFRGTAIASDPRTERFYREVASWADERGWLRLTFLRLGGRAIAFDFALSHGGSLYGLKGGFDPRDRSAGPGILIIRETIARAYAEGLTTYEFLGAADPYKLVWTDTVRERVRLQAFPTTVTGTAGYLAWAYGRPLAKQARGWVGSRRKGPRRPKQAVTVG